MEDLEPEHSRMIAELAAGSSHIGWFKTDLAIGQNDVALLNAFRRYNGSHLRVLQIEYSRFYGGTFETILESLSCPYLTHLYLTHDDTLSGKTIANFIARNNIYLEVLDIDTTSVVLTELFDIIREGRIEYLDCGSSMGSAEQYLDGLASAQMGQKCIINTARLLCNIHRDNGAFAPKTADEKAKRAALESVVLRIHTQNKEAVVLGARMFYGRPTQK